MNQPPPGEQHPAGPPGGYGVNLPPGVKPDASGPNGAGVVQEPSSWVSVLLGGLSLPSVFCCAPLTFLLALGGIITGILSVVRINSEPHRYRGKGVAITGIVLSVLAPLLYVLLMVFVGALSFIPAVMGP